MTSRIKGDEQGKESSNYCYANSLIWPACHVYLYTAELSFAPREKVEARKIEAITNIRNSMSLLELPKIILDMTNMVIFKSSTVKSVANISPLTLGQKKMKHNLQGIRTTYPVYLSKEALRNIA